MPASLIDALRLMAAAHGLRDPVLILVEAQDKSRRPRAPWWL